MLVGRLGQTCAACPLRTSAVMFIGSIKGLNKHSTAREGNYMGGSAF